MRLTLIAMIAASLALAACEAPLPGRSAGEQAARWTAGEWRDDIGNIWQASIADGKVTAKGSAGGALGLTLSGAFTPEGLPYTIAMADGSVIAEGEAKLVDEGHALFTTRLVGGQGEGHGLLHFGHPASTAHLIEAVSAGTVEVSALSGAWTDDAGNAWAVSARPDGSIIGVGASGEVVGSRFEGNFAGRTLTYVATAPDGANVAGAGEWDGSCHIAWRTVSETPLTAGGGQLHVNHLPGQGCDALDAAPAQGDAAAAEGRAEPAGPIDLRPGEARP
jgi:hypothetical protein